MERKVVLMYHDIVTVDDKTSGFQNESAFQYKVDETAFEEQVKALKGKNVVFSFDDGGVSFYTKAAPILEKYGFKGVFFISTSYIGTPGFLTETQIRDLAERGHEIGSHTHTHPQDISKLSREEMQMEWKQSYDKLISIFGDNIKTGSIPNGNSSQIVFGEAANNGFTDLYTSRPTTKVREKNKYRIIGRYVVHGNMTTQEVVNIATSRGTQFKLSVKWHLLNIIKKILGASYKNIKSKVIKKND